MPATFDQRHARASYLRSFIFGVEDSLVSTVGLLAGVAAAAPNRNQILVTGLIYTVVEAFSMAAGSFLSESEAEAYERGAVTPTRRPLFDGLIMFISYLGTGLIPVVPYLLLPAQTALYVSIVVSLVALAGLGLFGARLSHTKPLRHVLKMVLVGGIATGLGVAIGLLLQSA
ncbi:MAG: VIT1/CCC1 transporter family protein [Candidatus Andersenbacteria bacterium]